MNSLSFKMVISQAEMSVRFFETFEHTFSRKFRNYTFISKCNFYLKEGYIFSSRISTRLLRKFLFFLAKKNIFFDFFSAVQAVPCCPGLVGSISEDKIISNFEHISIVWLIFLKF